MFSKASYAYRSGRSALEAVEKIERYMAEKGGWVLKMDIHSFFDSILQDRLRLELGRMIKEKDVIELIMKWNEKPRFYTIFRRYAGGGTKLGGCQRAFAFYEGLYGEIRLGP